MLALLDALVSPSHDLSLARALKSPVFGASDADLTALALLRRESAHAGRSWWALLQTCAERLPPTLRAAAATLARYQTWVQTLPPHDALDAIFHHGELLQRFAQAARPELRESVLANLRALIAAALALGGGRYLTPTPSCARCAKAWSRRRRTSTRRRCACSPSTAPKGWRPTWC